MNTKDGRTLHERAELGKRINDRRTQMRITCVALAERCGLRNAKVLQNIEIGRRCVSDVELDSIAEALQCSTNYLLTGDEDFVTDPIKDTGASGVSFTNDAGALVIQAKRRTSKPCYVYLSPDISYEVRRLSDLSGWSITELVDTILVYGIDHLKIKGGHEHE